MLSCFRERLVLSVFGLIALLWGVQHACLANDFNKYFIQHQVENTFINQTLSSFAAPAFNRAFPKLAEPVVIYYVTEEKEDDENNHSSLSKYIGTALTHYALSQGFAVWNHAYHTVHSHFSPKHWDTKILTKLAHLQCFKN